MSSSDDYGRTDEQPGSSAKLKKRRIEQACDLCRRRKIRCEGPIEAGKCFNCNTTGKDCTYDQARKKRGRPKVYVADIERQLETLVSLLKTRRPSGDFSQQVGFEVHPSWFTHQSVPSPPYHALPGVPTPFQSTRIDAESLTERSDASGSDEDDDTRTTFLCDRMDQMHLQDRFFGKSSGFRFVQRVKKMKDEYKGAPCDDPSFPRRRARFWNISPWEQNPYVSPQPDFSFPDADLISVLVDLYFTRINLYMPLLHRPTFERGIATGLHLRDNVYGATVLVVCALGSRFCADPRVLAEGTDDINSAGWKWFSQVQSMRKSLFLPPRLYDLQLFSLCVFFLQGAAAPHAGWIFIGIGVRVAEDMGAHRRRVYGKTLTVEDELWKRAFWVLVCLDRNASATLGRPCAVQDEDFDLDLPANCDDEYWEISDDPEQNFKQPAGKPATTDFFICMVKLNQILALALRTIYAIDKSKATFGYVGKKWEQTIVAELDSALNKWVDDLPDHLRWDPNREDSLFFNQSASLYASYYHVQMLVHRPFIPSPGKASPLSFPSLAICTNAARSCSHVVDYQRRRNPEPLPIACSLSAVFSSAVVLLLNIWSGKRSGLALDPVQEMSDVYKCMAVLKSAEECWHIAGCLWDVLYELATIGDLPVPYSNPVDSRKRSRQSESNDASAYIHTTSPGNFDAAISPNNASAPPMSRPQRSQQYSAVQSMPSPLDDASMFSLPIHSDELGRLPLHGNYTLDQIAAEMDFMERVPPVIPANEGNSDTALPSGYDHLFGHDTLGSTPTAPLDNGTMDAFISNSLGSATHQQQDANGFGNTDIWSNAPTNNELDDWGAYIMGMLDWDQRSAVADGLLSGVPSSSATESNIDG
ncbi:hypothetical protein PLICRDRAFT_697043 [Plicaturopsis crispa FD-325 SS-3]|nr:hypothetical protein PLICRDRAFT_697043 [Plicaturopsis crispa FD-325 SS-3]